MVPVFSSSPSSPFSSSSTSSSCCEMILTLRFILPLTEGRGGKENKETTGVGGINEGMKKTRNRTLKKARKKRGKVKKGWRREIKRESNEEMERIRTNKNVILRWQLGSNSFTSDKARIHEYVVHDGRPLCMENSNRSAMQSLIEPAILSSSIMSMTQYKHSYKSI